MEKDLALLALHLHKDAQGNWYMIATYTDEKEERRTSVVYQSKTLRPVCYPRTGTVLWEEKK